MEQRQIGDTDLLVSALGFGTAALGTTNYGPVDPSAACDAVRTAVDHGITLFDTAEVYGPRVAEPLLARALGGRRTAVTLVTKVGFAYDNDGAVRGRDASYDSIVAGTEGSLRRLQTDVIDLLLLHQPDPATRPEETVRAFHDLRSAGKIRYYGVSNVDKHLLTEFQQHGAIAANELAYHLFDRRIEAAELPYCAGSGVGVLGFGTLGFGVLTGAFTADTTFDQADWRSSGYATGLPLFVRDHLKREARVTTRLAELATSHGRTLVQLAVAWVLDKSEISSALVGFRNVAELDECLPGAGWSLDPQIRSDIDRIFTDEDCPTYGDGVPAI